MLRVDGLKVVLPLAVIAVLSGPFVGSAEVFSPAVPLLGVGGDVTVKRPGQSEFMQVSEGRACPFGSIIQTGNDSAVTLGLAVDVSAKLRAGSKVRVNLEGSQNERAVISLLSGGATIVVNEGAMPEGNVIELLWLGGTIIIQKEGQFEIDLVESEGSATLTMSIPKGAAHIAGAGYSGVVAMKDAAVILESNQDLSGNRIQSAKESFVVSILTTEQTLRDITIAKNGQIKVYRKVLPNVDHTAVSILEIDPAGSILKTESYTQSIRDAEVRSLDLAAMLQDIQGVNRGDVNK